MADGKTHQIGAIVGASAVTAASLAGYIPTPSIPGAWSAVVLEPDLDLHQLKTASETTMMRLLPKPLDKAWLRWTTAYGKLFPHRSPLSHWPGLSTVIRMLFFLWPLLAASFWWFDYEWWEWFVFWQNWWIGATIVDAIHFGLDMFKK